MSLWHVTWSNRGFSPGTANSGAAWAALRARVAPRSVVIVGTSRAQAAIDPSVWRRVWPDRSVLNLSVVGSSPVLLLEHLAEDSSFSGIAVVDLPPFYTFNVALSTAAFDAAVEAYGEYRGSPFRRWEAHLRLLLPRAFPLRHPDLNWRSIVGGTLVGALPVPPRFTMRRDRFYPLSDDYRSTPLRSQDYARYRAGGRPASVTERDSIVRRLEASVRSIRARGGAVVILKLPTCGERRAIEEERYPSGVYWHYLKRSIDAEFMDDEGYPELDGDNWHCADGSHLHVDDSEPFTLWLAAAIRSWAVLEESGFVELEG